MTEKYGSSIPESFAPFADVSATKIHDALHKNNTKIQGVKMDAFSYSELVLVGFDWRWNF